jgi:hypothetical protein
MRDMDQKLFQGFLQQRKQVYGAFVFGACTSTMENIYGYGPLLFDKHSSPTFGA